MKAGSRNGSRRSRQPASRTESLRRSADPRTIRTGQPEDVRHTVVRWLPSTTENAVGPHVHDPRTGEILNGSVRMFHNILNLQRSWYFTQVARSTRARGGCRSRIR